MNSVQSADKSNANQTAYHVFWLIVATLAFALAVGLPVAGYTIYKKIRMVLYEQVMQDNQAISQAFELAIREARYRSSNEDEWLQKVQDIVDSIQVPSTGYVCLIDSDMRIKAYPNNDDSRSEMYNQRVGTTQMFPYQPTQGEFAMEQGTPLQQIIQSQSQQSVSGYYPSPKGDLLVDFRSIEINDQPWLIGVHQYDSGIKQHLKDIFTFFVILGSLLFAAIVVPFGIFTARLIGKHEKERADYINRIEEHVEEIETVAAQLQETNQRLNEMQEEKNRLYVRLSHDLRAPLNSVIGASAMLTEGIYGDVNDKQRKAITAIDRNANVLLKLIDNILELSRIKSGTLTLHSDWFWLNDLLIEVSENLRPYAREKNLDLQYTPNPDLPKVFTDRSKLYLVLQNLVSNAIQFTDEGFVRFEAQRRDDGVAVSVSDTGPGIEEDEQQKIFQAFHRGARSNSDNSGVGLGLAISQELTQLLGGSLELHSKPGAGTTFIVLLPASMLEGHFEKSSVSSTFAGEIQS